MRRIRLLLVAMIFGVATLLTASPAHAAGVEGDSKVIEVPDGVWRYATGIAIPIVLGLAFRKTASARLKSVILLLSAAVAGLVQTAFVQDGVAVISLSSIDNAVSTFIVAVGTLYGLLKPTGIDAVLKSTGGVIGAKDFEVSTDANAAG